MSKSLFFVDFKKQLNTKLGTVFTPIAVKRFAGLIVFRNLEKKTVSFKPASLTLVMVAKYAEKK